MPRWCNVDHCVYYDGKNEQIIDFFPNETDQAYRNRVWSQWSSPISRKILITISMYESLTIPQLKAMIGHSMSTLHDHIRRLQRAGLIETETIFVENKKIVLRPKILFVTKNPKSRIFFNKFFQGMWINNEKNERIIDVLRKNPTRHFTTEEIATRTKLPVDEVQMYLDNWESQVTRTLATMTEEMPFEKKTTYRFRKTDGTPISTS